ncbi:hypothetical protein B0T16DRAFT_419697 [Cercophora newfieldiana]|uniref:Uncharacterized protein n=1 Tax=Cercophora newfieldiana TaxID=92897 RepID=A0AA39XW42_9PEZI|nr:hypothetical protein B0T16DRAFT_419697 [Cercophora newfieldiana]
MDWDNTSGTTPPSPRPWSQAGGSGSQQKSKRRQDGSSESDGPLGSFSVSNVKFRVVTPARPLPLASYPLGDNFKLLEDVFGYEFQRKARQLASEIGIPGFDDAELVSRVCAHDPLDTLPTVLITVREWTEASVCPWQAVVERLKKYVDGRVREHLAGVRDTLPYVSIEMVHVNLTRDKYLAPLDNDASYPSIVEHWPDIKDGVFGILEKYGTATAGRMVCIALFKLGFDPHHDNPRTVYIAMDYDSHEFTWPPVLQEVQSWLDRWPDFDLHAHMEHNVSMPLAGFPLLVRPGRISAEEMEAKKAQFNMQWDPELVLRTQVNAGDDIGAGTYLHTVGSNMLSNPGVGTLGCWLEIKVKGDGWKTVALTNYHVVRPSIPGFQLKKTTETSTDGKQTGTRTIPGPATQKSHLERADKHGVQLRDRSDSSPFMIESPSRLRLNHNVKLIRQSIKDLQSGENRDDPVTQEAITRLEACEKKWTSFYDTGKQVLGTIFLASGCLQRTATNNRLDWALILPSDKTRIGRNLLPAGNAWTAAGYSLNLLPAARDGKIMRPQDKTSVHNMKKGHRVYKLGASTTCSIGLFERLQPDVVVGEEQYMEGRGKPDGETEHGKLDLRSSEYMFFGEQVGAETLPFSRTGDSGSLVWNSVGQVVGVLFRGCNPQQVNGKKPGISFVTPIEDIFKSIKEVSNGEIEDIRLLS